MKNLITWFKPHERQHLRAYSEMRRTGRWPEGFLPHDLQIPYGWHDKLAHRIADEFIEEQLSHWESGK